MNGQEKDGPYTKHLEDGNGNGTIGPSNSDVPYSFKDANNDFSRPAICAIFGSSELALTSLSLLLNLVMMEFVDAFFPSPSPPLEVEPVFLSPDFPPTANVYGCSGPNLKPFRSFCHAAWNLVVWEFAPLFLIEQQCKAGKGTDE